MPSIYQLLGLGGAGMPVSMTEDDYQQLAAQQQNSPVAALMGVTDPNAMQAAIANAPRSQDAAVQQGVDNLPAAQSMDTNNADPVAESTAQQDARLQRAQDAKGSDQTASDTDYTPPADGQAATDQTDTSTAQTSPSVLSSMQSGVQAAPDAVDSSHPSFIHQLLSRIADPAVAQGLIAAGASTLANKQYGVSGYASLGAGIQQGLATTNALRQQQAMNNLARYQAVTKNALDASTIAKNNADAAQISQTVGLQKARANVFQAIAQGQISPNDPHVRAQLASTGMQPADISAAATGWAPKLGAPMETIDPTSGKIMVQDRTENGVAVGPAYPKASAPIPVKAGETLVQPQAAGADGAAPTVATGGVPESQQATAREESNKAADAKTTADMAGQALQAYGDPVYQKYIQSGLVGKAKSYLQQKYSMATDPMAIIDAQINDLNKAKTLTTVLGSGIGKLDRPVQQAVMEGSLDVRSLPVAQKLQIAQMIYNQSNDTYQRMSRSASWDSNIVGNAVSKDITLPDGTVIKGGTTRDQHIMNTQQGNQLGLPTPKKGQAPVFAAADLQAEMKRRGLLK